MVATETKPKSQRGRSKSSDVDLETLVELSEQSLDTLCRKVSGTLGNPWDKSEEKIGVAGDEELAPVPHVMTISPYPPFICGVAPTPTIFTGTSISEASQASHVEHENQDKKTAAKTRDFKEPDSVHKRESEKPPPKKPTA
ncbi:MAG: hypothetical protein ACYS76_00030 [Planctomycetota bacterium]|jgi:hypothetical protein